MFELEYEVVPSTKSSDELHNAANIVGTSSQSKPFMSERFPLYPVNVMLSVRGEPFNMVEVSCPTAMQPNSIQLQLSNDGEKFSMVGQLKFLPEENRRSFVVRSIKLPQLVSSQFVRLQIMGYLPQKENLCRQVGLYGVKLYDRRFENTKFLFSLEAAHLIPRPLLELLKYLEWTKCQAKQQGDLGTCIDCQKQIDQAQSNYQKARNNGQKQKMYELEKDYLSRVKKYHELMKPVGENKVKESSPPKRTLPKQQAQQPSVASNLPISRPTPLQPIPPTVHNVFDRYSSIVDEPLLKLISSQRPIDHEKFLIELWSKLKSKEELTPLDEQLMLDSMTHFTHSTEPKVVGLALQVLNMACKKPGVGKAADRKYDQLLSRLLKVYFQEQLATLKTNIQEALLSLYPLTKPERYLDVLLNFPGRNFDQLKLAILQQVLTHYQLGSSVNTLNYLKKLVRDKQLPKPIKNSALEALATISQKTSLEKVVQHFKDLPTHEMLNIERLIKDKLGLSKQTSHRSPEPQRQASKPSEKCQYCQIEDPNFLDSDLYDMHCFRDCIFLTKCSYCEAVIQIPQLYSHYLKECSQSRNFKKCGECGIAIHLKEIQQHEGTQCLKKQVIMCPLCTANFISKDQLTKHILLRACPQNERALPAPPDS